MKDDYVMSPDYNAIVLLNTGMSIGSSIQMRLEHVSVEYYEEKIVVNHIHEIPTENVDKIIRDAGERKSYNHSREKEMGENSQSLEEFE